MPSPLWDWDPLTIETTRAMVHGAIEEACGEGLNVNRPEADTLISWAQAYGIAPLHLRTWIYEHHPKLAKWREHSESEGTEEWSAAALESWARERGYLRADEAPNEAPLGWSRDADTVTLRMTTADWQLLVLELGYIAGTASGRKDEPLMWQFVALANRLHAGNPDFTPYEIPEGKKQ